MITKEPCHSPSNPPMFAEMATWVVMLERAARQTPDVFRAHQLIRDIAEQRVELLPEIFSAMCLNLSAKDESLLRDAYGILVLTRQP